MNKNKKKLFLIQVFNKFSSNDVAENWFINIRWEDGISCPCCDLYNVSEKTTAKRSWKCKGCKKDFSTKTNTLTQGSNLGFRIWAIAIYLLTTNIKGISSTKLVSDLSITQKSAWHLSMIIRETYNGSTEKSSGTVEVDETYIGGKEKNKHANKKLHAGRESIGKKAIIGAKQRNGEIKANVINITDKISLHGFINDSVEINSNAITDKHREYTGLTNYNQEFVCHSVGEYVKGQAHINEIESIWALLKKGYHGIHHQMSHQHLNRYVNEFTGRHNKRVLDTTVNQMTDIASNMIAKQLRYKDLVA